MRLIGLDAASDWRKFGYAIGTYWPSEPVRIENAGLLGTTAEHDPQIAPIVEALETSNLALIAVDAPLGWPAAHGAALSNHRAGAALTHTKNELFRRRTDDFVKQLTGKQPLEVGADRIARATHTALDVIERLREATGKSIPIVWNRDFLDIGLIEVYPAATLRGNGISMPRYSRPENSDSRAEIAERLGAEVENLHLYATTSPHAFDACLCLLAARDYLNGCAVTPPHEYAEAAYKEGWIWVRDPRG